MAAPIKCPFYRSQVTGFISCENIEGKRINTPHEISGRTSTYLNTYCRNVRGWNKCSFAIELCKKHDKKIRGTDMWKEENLKHELGRYKKKVVDQMKQEQKLKETIAMQNQIINSSMLYIVHLAAKHNKMPLELEVDYTDLRKEAEKYELSYQPIENRGMKLFIREKETNTETEK